MFFLKMISALRVLYAALTFFILVAYSIVSSSICFFIPRYLRRKKNIKGQRVLITGAGNGLGRELAIEFSKHATCLILVDINRQSLLQTEKLLDRSSPVSIYVCDVSDYRKVYEIAKQIQKDAGDVDILVNNAGTVNGKFLWDLSKDKIVKTMDVNALAHFWTCKAFLPAMMEKNRGHIVSIISIASKIGGPRLTDYCASKFAALGFAESLQLELRVKKMDGIKITKVCPSFIDTKLFKGVELTFASRLCPTYVAKEIVAGVLEDEEMIFLPSYIGIFLKVHQLIPRWISIRIQEIMKITNVMDNFEGSGQLEKGTNIKNKEEMKM